MNDVVIRPLRFTDRVAEMRAFLETLGLQARIESEQGGWVDMLAGARDGRAAQCGDRLDRWEAGADESVVRG